jgi:uncharacterized Zn finger protein (UPF0148 family)
MITGWLAPEDCPDCGGPLLDTSTGPGLLTLACPGCGYSITWHITDPGEPADPDPADPGDEESP